MRLARPTSFALALFALFGAFAPPVGAIDVPPGFVVDNAVPAAAFDVVVGIKFLPDGRMLVLEKRGRLWVVKNGVRHPVPMWSAEAEVLNNHDRGALGLEVDPGFATNRLVYLLYTVDPDSNGVDTDDDGFGRLVRYQVSAADSNAVDPATRTVLLGTDWTNGILVASPTHTVGTLQFARDGSLLVSTGEGAQFNQMDPGGLDPAAFGPGRTDPAEDVGAFRSQYLGSLCGKILRLDPANGHGYPSNPFWDGDPASVRSRVWAYGLRNPYRFTIRPGTGSTDPADGEPGTLYVGDVGWGDTEELDIVSSPGRNFGWPCWEGVDPRGDYQAATPAHSGCGTVGSPSNPGPLTWPVATWSHTDSSESVPPGAMGRTSIGGAFYTGTQYPAAYRGRYFHGEFTFGWIKVATMDSTDQLVQLLDFAEFAGGPVDLESDPVSGDIFYVSIYTSQVRRIRWTGAGVNTPPVAAASADPRAGVAPLEVSFSSAGSSDPDGDPLVYTWNFGDGQGSTEPNPVHVFTAPGDYLAVLSVADTSGAIDTSAVQVVVSEDFAFPTTGMIDDFDRADGPLGGAWAGDTGGMAVADSALALVLADGRAVWDGATFGADQEAWFTFGAIPGGSGGHALALKAQGLAASDARIEASWDAGAQQASVSTWTAGPGWQVRGGPWPVAFQAGDRFGARARANGLVELFKNGARFATASVGDWPFAAAGGRLGLACTGAAGARLEEYGGGDAVLAFNTPPVAGIVSPAEGAFFVAGDTLALLGTAADAETPAAALAYRWDVDLHHNVHVHPSVEIVEDSTGSFVAENHDDGSGVWFEIRFAITDGGGLSDTARVSVFPEVDLSPSWVWADQPAMGTTDPTVFHFWVRNLGRMPAPLSRWRLAADGAVTLAEGDTLVPALDSVLVTCAVPPTLAAGTHVLRVVTDTLATLVETDEGNNGASGTVVVVEGPGTTGVPAVAAALRLSSAWPNPSAGRVSWTLELSAAARVGWSVHDVAGRELWREPEHSRDAGRWVLRWDGATASGAPAPAGVYLARVRVDGAEFTRRFAMLR